MQNKKTLWPLFVLALILSCGSASPTPTQGQALRGKASWYGGKHHGGPTASGERFNKNDLTAAHRKLPFGSRVRVTNLKNGNSVVVRINDRGPFGRRERIIDVSEAAAQRLDMLRSGVVPVRVEVIALGKERKRKRRRRRKRRR